MVTMGQMRLLRVGKSMAPRTPGLSFLVVSRAFQVLSDAEKKERYDKFGGDPDSRFGAGGAAASPFSGFGRPGAGGRGPMFEDEISPEELFNRFFGGQGFGFGKHRLALRV